MQNRKANVQLIVTTDAKGRAVYTEGAPALLNGSLSRLKNILQGQILHASEDAYSACIAVHKLTNMLDDNASVREQLTEHYENTNQNYLLKNTDREVEFWLVDYAYSTIAKRLVFPDGPATFPGFVSRIHISQFFGQPTPGYVDKMDEQALYNDETLVRAGYTLERTDWENMNTRTGGPTCGRIRHTVWRHASVAKQAAPVFPMDNPAGAVEAAIRSRNDDIARERVAEDVKPIPVPVVRDDLDELTGLRKPIWRVG